MRAASRRLQTYNVFFSAVRSFSLMATHEKLQTCLVSHGRRFITPRSALAFNSQNTTHRDRPMKQNKTRRPNVKKNIKEDRKKRKPAQHVLPRRSRIAKKSISQLAAEHLWGNTAANNAHKKLMHGACTLTTPKTRDVVHVTQVSSHHVLCRGLPGVVHFEARTLNRYTGQVAPHWANKTEFLWACLAIMGDHRPSRFAKGAGCVSFFKTPVMNKLARA